MEVSNGHVLLLGIFVVETHYSSNSDYRVTRRLAPTILRLEIAEH